MILVDELQRQLDRRGRRDDDGDSSELSALLSACPGDAHRGRLGARLLRLGRPRARGRAARFLPQQVNLGAPPTVTRDPATLVTALAGAPSARLAHPRHLRLARPPDPTGDRVDDDTVVVFSSPLTPPLVPEPAALEWSSAAEAPAPTPSIPPVRRAGRRRRDLPAGARCSPLPCAWPPCSPRRARCAPPRPIARPSSPASWPGLRSSLAARRVLARGSSLGEPSARMKLATRAALAETRAAWGAVRGEADDATRWSARLRQVAEEQGARASAWWILPGLRVDLMSRLESRVLSPLGLRRIDGGVTRSLSAASMTAPATSRWPRRLRGDARLATYAMALAEPGSLEDAALRAEQNALAAMRSYAGGFVGRTAILLMADVGGGGA
ncbi:MAG: hypothetical protein IPF99_41020 [Deltaproteobacteria bacterium]|nr:hypothetical protein [Deltaproteobacteria bacterium]